MLRHLCNNPPCVLHAVEGTHQENAQDIVDAGYHPQASKTACHAGHPFDEANTYWRLGHRYCRECDRIRHLRRPNHKSSRFGVPWDARDPLTCGKP